MPHCGKQDPDEHSSPTSPSQPSARQPLSPLRKRGPSPSGGVGMGGLGRGDLRKICSLDFQYFSDLDPLSSMEVVPVGGLKCFLLST